MSQASLDRVLAVLIVALAATGWLTLRAGAPQVGWVFTLHGIVAGVLAIAVVAKLQRSVPKAAAARRFGRLALGLAVGLATTVALVGGFLWVASGELLSLGSWTVMTLHAWVGLGLVPLVVVHLMPRRWRLLRPGPSALSGAGRWLSRRSLLAAGGLAVAGLGLFGAVNILDRLRGGERRFTGSRWLPAGGIPPATTFYGEPTPTVDARRACSIVIASSAPKGAAPSPHVGSRRSTAMAIPGQGSRATNGASVPNATVAPVSSRLRQA